MPTRGLVRAASAVIAVVAGLTLGAAPKQAGAYTILDPNNGSFAGKSIADWTAAWWTWALQAPVATSPLFDTTGAFANTNNDGPVFFIAGNTATRTFTVPAGRPFLLPLINAFDIEPAPPAPPPLAYRITTANSVVQGFVNAVDTGSLFASIDGNTVPNPADYLEVTGIFSIGPTQPGSYLNSLGVPPGVEGFPTKSGGYWLMVDGLTPGSHQLHFGGASAASVGLSAFSSDTTDFINVVVPEPGSALLLLSALALCWCRRVSGRVVV
jgi:hypothetical protein